MGEAMEVLARGAAARRRAASEHKPATPGAPRGFGLPSSSCLAGSLSARIVDALAPGADEPVIDTRWSDGFAGSALDGALRARGVTSLVVTGTMTDIGVLATVIGAFNREYRVTVVGDGVATLGPEIQRAALDIVARAYGRVVSSRQVIDTLSAWK
jgi:nicotinamidase-related amidase